MKIKKTVIASMIAIGMIGGLISTLDIDKIIEYKQMKNTSRLIEDEEHNIKGVYIKNKYIALESELKAMELLERINKIGEVKKVRKLPNGNLYIKFTNGNIAQMEKDSYQVIKLNK